MLRKTKELAHHTILKPNSTNNYFFKFIDGNTRKRCEICSGLTVKTPEQRQ